MQVYIKQQTTEKKNYMGFIYKRSVEYFPLW